MSHIAPVCAATAIVLAMLSIKHAFAVIKKRQHHKLALGSGSYPDLEAAIRAHGNFAEHVPLSMLLLLCAELNRSPLWLLASAALALVAGRYVHALAISGGGTKRRVLGMKLTFASLAMGIVANLWPVINGLVA